VEELVKLGVKKRHVQILKRNGIKTLEDLLEYVEKHEDPIVALLKFPGMGAAGATRIKKALEAIRNARTR